MKVFMKNKLIPFLTLVLIISCGGGSDNQAKKAEIRDRLAKSGDTYWRGNSLWMRDYVGDNKRELEEYAYGYCRGADEIIKPFEIVFYDRNGRSKLKVSCF